MIKKQNIIMGINLMIMITLVDWRENKHTHTLVAWNQSTKPKKKQSAHGAHLFLDVEVGAGGDEGLHALHLVPASSRDKGRVAGLGRRAAGGRGRRGKKERGRGGVNHGGKQPRWSPYSLMLYSILEQ